MKSKLIFVVAFMFAVVAKAQYLAPASITNLQVALIATAGSSPYGSCGSYYFITAPRTNTFQIKNLCGTIISTGTYQYARTSTNSARITYTDSVVGSGNTEYITFRNNLCGSYSLTNTVKHGWQRGKFMFMNK